MPTVQIFEHYDVMVQGSAANNWHNWGRGCGQMVSMFAFYSDDTSSSPAKAYSFLCKFCVWKKRK